MQDLIQQECFELEVLDRLNSAKILNNLVFVGGTMLRLCYGLNRFSVDLDFWIIKEILPQDLFRRLKECLINYYSLKDATQKFYTLLFEIKSPHYPRGLKIEIRKGIREIKTEKAIAYSKFSNTQVLLRVISLNDMMKEKIAAVCSRKEIRDAFDIEFLLKKGIDLDAPQESLTTISEVIGSFKKRDYTVKLGSLLEEAQRKYYIDENFKILKIVLDEKSGMLRTK